MKLYKLKWMTPRDKSRAITHEYDLEAYRPAFKIVCESQAVT